MGRVREEKRKEHLKEEKIGRKKIQVLKKQMETHIVFPMAVVSRWFKKVPVATRPIPLAKQASRDAPSKC